MRTKNAFKIVLSSIILQVIIVISGLILPKLLIEVYGSIINGLVSSIKQLLNYLSVITLGLGAASQVALYKPLKEKKYSEINGILSATRIFFNKTGYVFIVISILATIIYPFIILSEVNYFTTMFIMIIVSVGSIIQYTILSKYTILLVADQRNYIASKIAAEGIIINTVITIFLIYIRASIEMVQLVGTIVYIFRLFTTINYVKKNYPYVDYYAKPNFESISGRWQVFSYEISGVIILYTPMILITLFCGLNEASVFSVYNMVFSSLCMIVNVFVAGFSASFGNVIVEENISLLRKTYNTYEYIYNNILYICYTCAIILIIPFIKVYIKNDDGVNYVVPLIGIMFALSGLTRGIRTPCVTLVEAANKFKENKLANIFEAISNVLLSFLFIFNYGIVGVLFANLVTSLIRSILYIFYSYKNILKTKPFKIILVLTLNSLLMYIMVKVINVKECYTMLDWFIQAIKVSVITTLSFVALNSIINFEAAKDLIIRIKLLLKK